MATYDTVLTASGQAAAPWWFMLAAHGGCHVEQLEAIIPEAADSKGLWVRGDHPGQQSPHQLIVSEASLEGVAAAAVLLRQYARRQVAHPPLLTGWIVVHRVPKMSDAVAGEITAHTDLAAGHVWHVPFTPGWAAARISDLDQLADPITRITAQHADRKSRRRSPPTLEQVATEISAHIYHTYTHPEQ